MKLGTCHTVETKKKMSLAKIGKPMTYSAGHADFNGDRNPFWGKHHTDGVREKISLSKLANPTIRRGYRHSEATKEKIRIKAKIRLSDSTKNSMYGKHFTEETKAKMSRSASRNWKNDKYVAKQMRSRKVKPNQLELSFQQVLDECFPNEWKYVGDGQFVLGGRCPDFLNIDGKKQLIELFGDYWHRGESPEDKMNHYKKYGFECIVIWENEILHNSNMQDFILSKIGHGVLYR